MHDQHEGTFHAWMKRVRASHGGGDNKTGPHNQLIISLNG